MEPCLATEELYAWSQVVGRLETSEAVHAEEPFLSRTALRLRLARRTVDQPPRQTCQQHHDAEEQALTVHRFPPFDRSHPAGRSSFVPMPAVLSREWHPLKAGGL